MVAVALLALSSAFVTEATPIICIDPGHPSEVGVGTKGRKATELEVAWDVAQSLKAKLEANGYRTVMTRDSLRTTVTNRERAEVANRAKATLMVRLHCDASSGSGFSVYYPDRQGTTSTGVTGPSMAVIARTAPMAKRFHTAMADVLKGHLPDEGLRSDVKTAVGAKQGALTGSIHSEVPAVLVEMVVLTNPRDEAFIVSQSGKRKMVEAISAGVDAATGFRKQK